MHLAMPTSPSHKTHVRTIDETSQDKKNKENMYKSASHLERGSKGMVKQLKEEHVMSSNPCECAFQTAPEAQGLIIIIFEKGKEEKTEKREGKTGR